MKKGANMRAAVISAREFSSYPPAATASHAQARISPVSDQGAWASPAGNLHLTPRQRDVLALLCEGLPNKLICRRLNISSGTVKAHISSILRELGVSSRLQAVVAAREAGLQYVDYETTE